MYLFKLDLKCVFLSFSVSMAQMDPARLWMKLNCNLITETCCLPSCWCSGVTFGWLSKHKCKLQANVWQEGERNDHCRANTSSHFCEQVGRLCDVFKCVITVFSIGNNTFLQEVCVTVEYIPRNKIFTCEALKLLCCLFPCVFYDSRC